MFKNYVNDPPLKIMNFLIYSQFKHFVETTLYNLIILFYTFIQTGNVAIY